jgi:hypothetical protein
VKLDVKFSPAQNWRKIIAIHKHMLANLKEVDANHDLVECFQRLHDYLSQLEPSIVDSIISREGRRTIKPARDAFQLSKKEILDLEPNELRNLLQANTLHRKDLEKVAAVRFEMTVGGLSNLRSRGALTEKLLTLLDHEATHASIARVAGSST